MERAPPQRNLPSPSEFKGRGFSMSGNSPFVVIAIVVLAAVFFVSGVVFLVIRYLRRPTSENPDDMESISALHGQLRRLFQLHDSGVDQLFLDAFPVFRYKSVLGSKAPFDCAVCLCEFVAEDKLRLLPKCSHAFHLNCIDTWLLSHSSCPLCRASLVHDLSSDGCCSSPKVMLLESESGSSRGNFCDASFSRIDSFHENDDCFHTTSPCPLLSSGGLDQDEEKSRSTREKLVHIKLGKCRSSHVAVEETSDAQTERCFSMGSFAYILDESEILRVPIQISNTKQCCGKKPCSCDSSNIWLNGKRERLAVSEMESLRRAYSTRLLINRNQVTPTMLPDLKIQEKGMVYDEEEMRKCRSLGSQVNFPYVGTRTLLWLMGRHSKNAHDSPASTSV